jgi:hypothetical protein
MAARDVNVPDKKGAHRMDREKMETVRWLRPRIIAEIAFNEQTQVGHLRHSKFLRLRDDADVRTKDRTKAKQKLRPSDQAGHLTRLSSCNGRLKRAVTKPARIIASRNVLTSATSSRRFVVAFAWY